LYQSLPWRMIFVEVENDFEINLSEVEVG